MKNTNVIIDLPGEIWKPVKGFEGFYEVSNKGRVKSLDRYVKSPVSKSGFILIKGKLRKPRYSSEYNYLYISLSREGKTIDRGIHRLVAEAFITNPDPINKIEVNHIDEDKDNNTVENLEWVTPKENANHGTRNERVALANGKAVEQYTLDNKLVKRYANQTIASKETGICRKGISNALLGKVKTAGGFKWKSVA